MSLWLGAGAALRTWNRPRARGYGRHMGQRPAVAVVLPVKGHHAHSEANWMNQLAMDYEGGDVQVRGVPGRMPVRAADTRRTDSSDRRRRRRRRRGLGWKQGLTDRDAGRGPAQYLFVLEARADPAYGQLRQLVETLRANSCLTPRQRVELVVAGRAMTCSQKLHNMLAGLARAAPAAEYVLFLDDDIKVSALLFPGLGPFWSRSLLPMH